MAELLLEEVTLEAGDTTVVHGARLQVDAGELVALLGPNGAGKSTLLRAAVGLTAAAAGRIWLAGEDPHRMAPRERARRAAYLPQLRPLAWPVRVRDVVALGRYAHGAAPPTLRGADREAVHAALTACDLDALASRRTDTLSGGELARVHVARALATRAPILVADEPVAALDPQHQFRVMDVIRRFVDGGRSALVVLHEPALAAHFAHRLVWLRDGRVLADGPPRDTLNAELMRQVYGLDCDVHEVQGQRLIALPERMP
jgi:iron complex transport system ATP-binding protein